MNTMNESPEVVTPEINSFGSQPAISSSFYQALVLKFLAPMTQGRLVLTLPSGQVVTFGDGKAPIQATVRIKNMTFFRKCILAGDIGFGESYVDGDWETDDLTQVIAWMILNVESNPAVSGSHRRFSMVNLLSFANRLYHLARANTVSGSRKNIEAHYDLSNEFFQLFLDPSMTYSSAYFATGQEDLQTAQTLKYDRLCQKLKLCASDHVLEIGSGWGGFAVHAAKTYGCKITTITISHEQYAYAKKRFKDAGLDHLIDIQMIDYRKVQGTYEKVVSIEMLEAVGHEYLPAYFQVCHDRLKKSGLLALQVIISPDSRYNAFRKNVDWIQKHIFPGSLLPSIAAINQSVNKTGDLFQYNLEDLGQHYTRTLKTWRDTMNTNAQRIKDLGFDDAFLRKWNYYFSYCEAAFRMRNISVVQMVYARPNNTILV